MGESLKNEDTIREYLLGRVSDETTLEGIEELLFTDEDFCTEVALVEDGLINDYVLGALNEKDDESFRATLDGNTERQFKVSLTQALREKALAQNLTLKKEKPSFFESIQQFFRQPQYAGAFALLLIAVLVGGFYLLSSKKPDELAELRSIYQKERPTESRISQFDYAPLSQLRGEPDPAEQKRLRRIENSLIEATEQNPNAQTHHALGVFYLTQQKQKEAIKEFESAIKFSDKDAKIHNDLGASHFELSKTGSKERRLEELAQSVEAFTKATELDGNLLEALFNKALAQQELGLMRQAGESWTLYLQKDSSSQWAAEARKNLERIEGAKSQFKSDEEVLADFLDAYRKQDVARAQKIHNETKGLLRKVAVPLQLSQRWLVSKKTGNEADAKESLDAMAFIGRYEQDKYSEFFSELAEYYANAPTEKIDGLLKAKSVFADAYSAIDTGYAEAITLFEKSRDLFNQLGNTPEADVAEIWAAQFLPDVAKIAEGRTRLAAIIASSNSKRFKILLPAAHYWLAMSDNRQNEISESSKNLKSALRLAMAGDNIFEAHHAEDALALNYTDLGELDRALAYESQMLPDRDIYYQSVKQSLRDLGTLADLTLNLKFYSTSMSFSKEAVSIIQKELPDSTSMILSLQDVVEAASAKKEFDTALKYANDSMQIVAKLDDSAENTRMRAQTYVMLADLNGQTNNCNEALANYDKALELYGRLPEVTDGLYGAHKGKLFCFQKLNRREDFSNELTTVLKLSEEYRATIREDDSRQAFFASEQGVFDAATSNAINGQDSRGAYAFAEASKARSLLDFVESKKSIAEVEKAFGPVAQPLKLEEIQKRLPEQVQIVQYAVLPDRLAIWIVSKTRFELIEKPITATDLEDKIAAFQRLIIGKGSTVDIKTAGQELHALLIPHSLSLEKQICFIPDKSLHQLSFASLVSPAGKYLLEDYVLFYSPSASVLVLATENARGKEQVINESLLSIGNPDFDREENPNLSVLPDAETEAKVIAGAYQKSQQVIRGEATKDNFLINFAKVEVIHFAGHFVANPQSPGNSKLLFAGGDLRSNKLGSYKLPKAKLVVLSACQTGFERYSKSEGTIGIARTLLALGAPVIVASQWKVDSAATKDLMISFHQNRKQKGLGTAESLRRAQLEVLKRDETTSPFYWAAFSMFGGYSNY